MTATRSALLSLTLAAVLPTGVVALLASPLAAQELGDPNVVIILADDLGVDRVGVYGDPDARTPVIDQLAAEGALFTNAYSETVCSPTRAALLTGTYPHRWRLSNAVDVQSTDPAQMLPLGVPSLPDALPPHYRSIAIGKWHLANESVGLDHANLMGFDHFEGMLASPADAFGFKWTFQSGVTTALSQYVTTHIVDRAIQQVPQDGTPFLLYVSLTVPHKPLHTPPAPLHSFDQDPGLDDESMNATLQFRAATEAMDHELGRLLDALPPNTYVFLLSDNGTIVEAVDGRTPRRQSKGFVHEGGIRVPFVVWGPGIFPGPRPGLTHVVDVPSTVAALTGGDASGFVDGREFTDALYADPTSGRETAYWRRTADFRFEEAARAGRWKIVRDRVADRVELFDLATDPGEQQDLSRTQPDVLARMERLLDRLGLR